jgi:hypothetical protein
MTNLRIAFCNAALLFLIVVIPSSNAATDDKQLETLPPDFLIAGPGGVYLLAEQGELIIDLEKQDPNTSNSSIEMQAILVGPDREILETVILSDDGMPRGSGSGPRQIVRLKTDVPHKGIYGLNITVSGNRYGSGIAWGLRTNCERYVIETSRGHKDERRREPIILTSGRPSDACFIPPKRAFNVTVSLTGSSSPQPLLFDSDDQPVLGWLTTDLGQWTCPVSSDGERSEKPWRLHVPSGKATINIDGVTEWKTGDPYVNLNYWSPSTDAFFPYQSYRWTLSPYQRTLYAQPGETIETTLTLNNSSPVSIGIRLACESEDLEIDEATTSLSSGRTEERNIRLKAPNSEGEERVYRVLATIDQFPEMATFSTLTVKTGVPPYEQSSLPIPHILRPYEHENKQFGHTPDFPTIEQPYFGPDNRPYVWGDNGIATLRDGGWATTDLRSTGFGSARSTKIAFDEQGTVYALASAGSRVALLRSTDEGQTYEAFEIPGCEGRPCSFDIEQFSGNNPLNGPPPIVRYTRTSGSSDPRLRWRSVQDIELILPFEKEGRIEFEPPVLLSEMCIGLSQHSGIPSTVVSYEDRVHVSWGEATDPAETVPGVPTYVATYDRSTGLAGEPALVGYGPPANDVHNSPSMTIDADGRIHILIGTHGRPFQYVHSLQSNDAGGGWSESELMGENLPQTYVGMVCDSSGTLHVAYRYWRYNAEPHPTSHHATLAYSSKRPGEPWTAPRVLVAAAFSEYSIFYHRLLIDRRDRLFLSYDYWSTYWFYRTDHFGDRRTLIMSGDDGETWKLVMTRDLE